MVTFLIGVLVGAINGFFCAAIISASPTQITEEDLQKWDAEQRAKEEKRKKRRAKHERRKRLDKTTPENFR